MKTLIYFFMAITLYAQDSLLVHQDINYNLASNSLSLIPLDLIEKKSILELKYDRSWKSAITSEINEASIIKYKQKDPNFIDSDLFLVMVGSAIALGATAAYFKLESDKTYEKYLKTNDKSLLNKTDDYDLYSGLALGALEINFGFLIYKFLTD